MIQKFKLPVLSPANTPNSLVSVSLRRGILWRHVKLHVFMSFWLANRSPIMLLVSMFQRENHCTPTKYTLLSLLFFIHKFYNKQLQQVILAVYMHCVLVCSLSVTCSLNMNLNTHFKGNGGSTGVCSCEIMVWFSPFAVEFINVAEVVFLQKCTLGIFFPMA